MSKQAKVRLPNFVVAGAAKSGSTSLYHYLKGHPEIFLPEKKESRFFANEVLTNTLGYNKTSVFGWDNFKNQYTDATETQKAIGDFGNLYMIYPEIAIPNIKKHLGEQVKIVFIIRNPIKRSYSAYQMARRNFYEDQSFEQGLVLEEERLQEAYVPCDIIAYKKMGRYAKPIVEFKKHFDVHTIVLEEMQQNPNKELESLFKFLGVDPGYQPETKGAHNTGGEVPNTNVNVFKVQKMLKSLKPILGFIPGLSQFSEWIVKTMSGKLSNKTAQKAEPLSKEMEQKLFEIFKDDIENTSELLNKDLKQIWQLNGLCN